MENRILVVVDMQNDFVGGSLGSEAAQDITLNVLKKVANFPGRVIFTRDTHEENYMETQEGGNLPVPHCIRDSQGWQIREELEKLRTEPAVDKPTFGSRALGELLLQLDKEEKIESITLVGLCTDICVISNALLAKAFLPEVPITVDAACCAGVTPESHKTALSAMKMCQIRVENE